MPAENQHEIKWLDAEREPQCPPNPAFPNGVDLRAPLSGLPDVRICKVELPYPAKRIGLYVVSCKKCGTNIAVTTAGRPDDPRSVEVECRDAVSPTYRDVPA